jgi:hypothetical protein
MAVVVTLSPASRHTPQPEPDRLPWSILGPEFISRWGYPRGKFQPEHVEILGQNGSGKSYFEATILAQRAATRGSHVTVIATKEADATLIGLGWPVIDRWPANYGQNQVIFWPKIKGLDRRGMVDQREKIRSLLAQIWQPKANMIVSWDEIHYVDVDLGLRTEVTRYFREGRGLGITNVATTQRPAGVNRWIHSETPWKVLFAPQDEEDAMRMAEVAGNRRRYTDILLTLNRAKYEFLLIRGLTGESYISHVDTPLAGAVAKKAA